MADDTAPVRRGRKPSEDDGRRQFLTKMKVDIIKAIKQAALEDDTHAWQIMEEAAQQWLERRRTRKDIDCRGTNERDG